MTTSPTPAATLATLHDRLVAAAADADLLDVAYRTVDSPVGSLLVAATAVGVVRVAFEGEGHDDVLTRLAADLSPRVLHDRRRLDPAARALDAYFAGAGRALDVPLDLRLARGFRRAVLDRLTAIPYGGRASYAQVAAGTGSPRAVRAVGTACATNPVPLFVPCHRVVRSDGGTGSYRGGPAAKALLLDLESAAATAAATAAAGPPTPGGSSPGGDRASG